MAVRYKSSINANYGQSKDFVFSMVEDFEPDTVSGATTELLATLFYKSSIGGGTWSTLTPAGSISEIGSTGFYVINLSVSEMSPSNGEDDYMILQIRKGANGGGGAVSEIIINLAPIPADLKEIDGQDTNGNNATLNLKQLHITNNAGTALIAHSTAGGHGIEARSNDNHGLFANGHTYGLYAYASDGIGLNAESITSHGARFISSGGSGAGLYCQANDNHGAHFIGNGNSKHGLVLQSGVDGHGLLSQGHGTGNGVNCSGGATSGHGINANGNGGGNGINAYAWGTGNAIACLVQAGNGTGLYISGNGSGNGMSIMSGATGSGIVVNAQSGHGIFSSCTGANHALTLSNLGTGNALKATSVGASAAIFQSTGGNGHGIFSEGNGTGAGCSIGGGATGNGIQMAGAMGLKITGLTSFGTEIVSNASHGMYIHSTNVNGYGMFVEGKNGAYFKALNGHGIYAQVTSGDGHGIYAKGTGTGNGFNCEGNIGIRTFGAVEGIFSGGATGLKLDGNTSYGLEINSVANTGMYVRGGGAFNYGVHIEGQVNGIFVDGQNGNAIWASSTGGNGKGILATGNGSGSGIQATKGGTGTYDIQAQELIDIESKIDVIDTNVDDIETTVNTIDGKCDTINNNTQDTNTKLTNAIPTINDTNSKVTTIDSKVDVIDANVDSIKTTVENTELDVNQISNQLNDTFNTVEQIESIVENVDATTQDSNTKITSMQPLVTNTNTKVNNIDNVTQDTNTKVTGIDIDIDTIDNTTQDTNSKVTSMQSQITNIDNNMLQLDSQIDGINLQVVFEHLHSMSNGRIQFNFPSPGQVTFFKRDNITPAFVMQSSEFERIRV